MATHKQRLNNRKVSTDERGVWYHASQMLQRPGNKGTGRVRRLAFTPSPMRQSVLGSGDTATVQTRQPGAWSQARQPGA